MDDELRRLLDNVRPDLRPLVAALRNVVQRTVPHAAEPCLWDGVSYHRPQVGGRVKGAVCQINCKAGQVWLDFIHGVRLEDPSGLLQGDRFSKRFVPIATVADAERPELEALIRQAAALDPTKWADPPADPGQGRG